MVVGDWGVFLNGPQHIGFTPKSKTYIRDYILDWTYVKTNLIYARCVNSVLGADRVKRKPFCVCAELKVGYYSSSGIRRVSSAHWSPIAA